MIIGISDLFMSVSRGVYILFLDFQKPQSLKNLKNFYFFYFCGQTLLVYKKSRVYSMSKTDEDFQYPKKARAWTSEFKFRAHKRWKKSELPGSYKTNWVPETPPKFPTDNPWVDCLQKQPDAPESTQTCHPSKWVYDSRFRGGAHYSHGRPFVDKDGWFTLWKLSLLDFWSFSE